VSRIPLLPRAHCPRLTPFRHSGFIRENFPRTKATALASRESFPRSLRDCGKKIFRGSGDERIKREMEFHTFRNEVSSSFLPPSRQRKSALIFRLDPYFFSRTHARGDLQGLWKVTPKSTDKYPYIPAESILPRDKTESVGSPPASAGDSSGIRNFPHFAERGSHPRTGAATCDRAALQLKCGPGGAAACRFRKASFSMSRRISDRRNPRESVQRAVPNHTGHRYEISTPPFVSHSPFLSLFLSRSALFTALYLFLCAAR